MTNYFAATLQRSGKLFIDLARVMIPVMVLVRIGESFGLSNHLAGVLTPLMSVVNLPAETGIVWAIAILVGLQGGIGAYVALLPGMEITVGQHSVLCAMMLFAHSLPVEQSIARRAGASFVITTTARVVTAILYALLIAAILNATGALSAPFELAWLGPVDQSDSWTSWSFTVMKTLIVVFTIIVFLLILLDILAKIGVTQCLTRALTPPLRAVGIDHRLAPTTTIGVLLGLTYGGGLIIEATRKETFDKRSLLLAMTLLSLCHSMIEDTLLMLAIGANFWIVFVGRALFTYAMIMMMAWLLPRDTGLLAR